MSKIFGYYKDNLDRAWFESSNVKYSECVDNVDALKTVRVVFNNGGMYEYSDVNVNDYLLFREDASQGKALNKYIKGKGYKYKKLDDADVSTIDEELEFRSSGGLFLKNDDDGFNILGPTDDVLYSEDEKLDDKSLERVVKVLDAVGKKVKFK